VLNVNFFEGLFPGEAIRKLGAMAEEGKSRKITI